MAYLNAMIMGSYDTVIIGGGSAGMCVGRHLTDFGEKCFMIESGPMIYDRRPDDPREKVQGVGGAAIFGSGIWNTVPRWTGASAVDRKRLANAFEAFRINMLPYHEIPPLPTEEGAAGADFFLDVAKRKDLAFDLIKGWNIAWNSHVISVHHLEGSDDKYEYLVVYRANGIERSVLAKNIVYATGCLDGSISVVPPLPMLSSESGECVHVDPTTLRVAGTKSAYVVGSATGLMMAGDTTSAMVSGFFVAEQIATS